MKTQVAMVRGVAVGGSGTAVYTGNPLRSETVTADGEATTIRVTLDEWQGGWEMIRVSSDTLVYAKIGSVATAVPRYMVQAGGECNIRLRRADFDATTNLASVFVAAA